MTVSTWDEAPAATGGDSWKGADTGADDGWSGGNTAVADGFTEDMSGDNVSKHAGGQSGAGAADGGCRICGQDGHFARDCPDKPEGGAMDGKCFNCGEDGHISKECPNERVERAFTGACHICGQEGHRANDCENKPEVPCQVCGKTGHKGTECTENRVFAEFKVAEMKDEDAWVKLEAADKDKDIDDIKEAVLVYAKAVPDLSLDQLEAAFRDASMNTYIIAKEQEVSDTHTIVNLKGEPDQKYVVSYQFTEKPRRAKFAEGWPSSPEENMQRLAEAGFVMDRMVDKCSNCEELGHKARDCTQEKMEKEGKVKIMCANCDEEGHRARDCPNPRKSRGGGCKNCGQEGHIAKECPEPRSAEGVECKSCGEMGHFSRDCPSREPDVCRNCGEEGHRAKECEKERVMKCRNCDGEGHISKECPEPRNMAKVQCRNCDEFGHTGRDCPKPRDWSRVKCENCEQMGHTKFRCKEPPKEEGDGGFGDSAGGAGGGDGGWAGDDAAPAATGGW